MSFEKITSLGKTMSNPRPGSMTVHQHWLYINCAHHHGNRVSEIHAECRSLYNPVNKEVYPKVIYNILGVAAHAFWNYTQLN